MTYAENWVENSLKCPFKVIVGFMCLKNSVEPKTSRSIELFSGGVRHEGVTGSELF